MLYSKWKCASQQNEPRPISSPIFLSHEYSSKNEKEFNKTGETSLKQKTAHLISSVIIANRCDIPLYLHSHGFIHCSSSFSICFDFFRIMCGNSKILNSIYSAWSLETEKKNEYFGNLSNNKDLNINRPQAQWDNETFYLRQRVDIAWNVIMWCQTKCVRK